MNANLRAALLTTVLALPIAGILATAVAQKGKLPPSDPPLPPPPTTDSTHAPKPLAWGRINELYAIRSQSRLYQGNPIWFGANATTAWGIQGKNVWHTVDVGPYLADDEGVTPVTDATGGELACILVITGWPSNHSTADGAPLATVAPVDPDLMITFRATGDTTAVPILNPPSVPNPLMGQVIAPLRGDGERTNMFTNVAMNGSKFDYMVWYPDDIPQWDGTINGGAAFAVNCSIQKWWR